MYTWAAQYIPFVEGTVLPETVNIAKWGLTLMYSCGFACACVCVYTCVSLS